MKSRGQKGKVTVNREDKPGGSQCGEGEGEGEGEGGGGRRGELMLEELCSKEAMMLLRRPGMQLPPESGCNDS